MGITPTSYSLREAHVGWYRTDAEPRQIRNKESRCCCVYNNNYNYARTGNKSRSKYGKPSAGCWSVSRIKEVNVVQSLEEDQVDWGFGWPRPVSASLQWCLSPLSLPSPHGERSHHSRHFITPHAFKCLSSPFWNILPHVFRTPQPSCPSPRRCQLPCMLLLDIKQSLMHAALCSHLRWSVCHPKYTFG